MKKLLPILAIIVVVAILFGSTYNSLIGLSESVDVAWGQVTIQLKRRADLIPNLLNTVKGYAKHEESVLTEVTKARAGIDSAKTVSEYEEANKQMTEALNNLNFVVESYPELKADTGFRDLQAQLEGTENRIATERMRYNEAVEVYNRKVKRFPTNLMAGILGFEPREYFQISEADAEVPKVDF